MHRRKSSKDDDEDTTPRIRVQSTPQHNTTISPIRSTVSSQHSHSRTRSISTPFSPTSPSPLHASFQAQPIPFPTTSSQTHHHSRIHSRNLSIFFPRPGSLPRNSIAEDGAQEIEYPVDEEAPISDIPSSTPNVALHHIPRPTPLGQNFSFGSRPPGSAALSPPLSASDRSRSTSTTRRGHHHKHSMSHNFFSFLEPSPGFPPTPPPPSSASASSSTTQPSPDVDPATGTHPQKANGHLGLNTEIKRGVDVGAVFAGTAQFVLGAWLWVHGQEAGSLAVTGLGYWVVFDALGVGLTKVLPQWVAARSSDISRRSYGNARVETVAMFAQVVYLMFASIYVCKETVEHVLLSAGGGEGHHHHHGDEEEGLPMNIPILLVLLTAATLLSTARWFENHLKLVNVTGNRIPPLSTLIRSTFSSARHTHVDPPPTSTPALIFSNPYVTSPLLFCFALLCIPFFPPSQHRASDLTLASLIALTTFSVSYRACIVLGTVLLQTSPPRGLVGGRAEAFLRAMREVERHPQVLHLPAPHIWQVEPMGGVGFSFSSGFANNGFANGERGKGKGTPGLVVTLQVHVREDLGDGEVLALTRWAWERCVGALGGAEVTVGVVRG